jgi:hypothetical protein
LSERRRGENKKKRNKANTGMGKIHGRGELLAYREIE